MPSTTDDCKIYILRQLGEVHEASAPGMQIVAALHQDLFATDAWNVRNPHGFTGACAGNRMPAEADKRKS